MAERETIKKVKDRQGAFNTFSGRMLITTLGVVWWLFVRELLVGYLLSALLLVVGILVAVAGIRAWRK